MTDRYDQLRTELSDAGFFVPTTETMGRWDRIIPCSEGPPKSDHFGGRSFWIACVENTWYVGAWGSYVYRFPDADKLLPFAQAFLTASGSMGDFSPELRNQFGLLPLSGDESRRILPDERPEA